MRRPSTVVAFGLTAFVLIVTLTLLWTWAGQWTARPAASMAAAALEAGASSWVRSTNVSVAKLEVESEFEVFVPNSGGRRGALLVDTEPARYAYGLPIFLGLLLAARGPRLLPKAAIGYLLLLPAQAFSLAFVLLQQLINAAGRSAATLRAPQWQFELIAYCYQLGVLVLPTLVPVLLWLWLDRQFVADVLVRGWQQRETARSSR